MESLTHTEDQEKQLAEADDHHTRKKLRTQFLQPTMDIAKAKATEAEERPEAEAQDMEAQQVETHDNDRPEAHDMWGDDFQANWLAAPPTPQALNMSDEHASEDRSDQAEAISKDE